ncbi:MAG: aminotransferase class I/II-fold pyridoxal phosphate-dependent enzyme [Epsilonproteobacteria bacterium]|nr:aminotransferase class I/II-fold pyridoxal phosphate-dependent enzyme [Campylobacterota bacterium]
MKKDTIALHHGYDHKKCEGTMAVPIYQTTAYAFRDASHAAALFDLKESGSIYTRLNNPTTDIFEKRFAAYEGGTAAIATSSGMAAIFSSIINVAEVGDNIIISDKLYGGTVTLATHTLKRFGIEARIFDADEAKNLEEIIDDKSKCIIFESLSNPQIAIPDIEKIVSIAKKHKILTICDNTVASAALFNPIDWGVNIVVHSTSKYTTGQGTALGGVIVESEDTVNILKNNDRYYHFNEPDVSYHGLVFSELDAPFVQRVRLSVIRDTGAAPSPFNSWLLLQGLETLDIRMQKHSKNALEVAKFLESHPKVKRVSYPALESDKYHKRAKKYFKDTLCSGLLSFEAESFEAAKKIMNSTKIFSIVVNIGDSKSIITHPASTTHQQLSLKELESAGISPSLIRLSIGLEDSGDLIEDLSKALRD